MSLKIRKVIKVVEEMRMEMDRELDKPVQMVAVGAVIENPWAGQGYVEDLKPTILEVAPPLGEEIVRVLMDELGSADAVEAYGKAAIVGVNGEIEQGSALIHTLRFGNKFRDAVGGTAYLSFTNKRGPAGTSIQIPMMHKDDAGFRSHYITLEMHIEDAPAADEIIVVLGGSDGGRAHPRIGNRYMDLEEIAAEKATAEA